MNKIDLHIHTNRSDGEFSPKETVEKIAKAGIKIFAITDHDEIGALEEAAKVAQELGLTMIPGVEFSAKHNDVRINILAYGVNVKCGKIDKMIAYAKKENVKRIKRIIADLDSQFGVRFPEVKLEAMFKETSSFRSAHVAKMLIEYGYIDNIEQRSKYFDHMNVDMTNFEVEAKYVIDTINACGGIAVLAHPRTYMNKKKLGYDQIKNMVAELKELGLGGLEVYHSMHNEVDVEAFSNMAKEHNLLISCGSDYHGPVTKPKVELGIVTEYGLEMTEIKEITILDKLLNKK